MKNNEVLFELQELIKQRKEERAEDSYTSYLFKSGLDKVLKKLGEETSETIIAAKNLEACAAQGFAVAEDKLKEALKGEVGDMLYHLVVMLNILELDINEVEEVLRDRMQKQGNLKKQAESQTDKGS